MLERARIPAVKAGGSKIQDNPLLHSKLEASLGCVKPSKKASVRSMVKVRANFQEGKNQEGSAVQGWQMLTKSVPV